MDRFRVRRVECWGGTYLWRIVSLGWGHNPSTDPALVTFKTEEAARKRCDKMNADYQRYVWSDKIGDKE